MLIIYHIIWIPKYRKKILKGLIRERLIELLKECQIKLNIIIEVFEIMEDHIHLFVKGNLTTSAATIVKQLKGYSSYMLRKEFIWLKKYKSLWQA